MFATGLYFLMQKVPAPVVVEKVAETPKPKSVLPSRPEEVWSYIQALETRTIPVDDKTASSDKSLALTEEQRKILQAMAEEQKKAEQAAKQSSATQAAVSTSTVVPATTQTKESKTAVKNTPKTVDSNGKKYGLQCGAFKNQTQAESLKSRLSALGLNVRVNSDSDWHRVVVGPVGDRASTLKVQERATSIINCVVIGM